jgi:Fic family protein
VLTADPLLCPAELKAEMEARNALLQLDYIAYVVNEERASVLREMHVLELHRLAISEIYACAGTYRDIVRRITMEGSLHVPPEPWQVRALLLEMLGKAEQIPSVLRRAAYVLWRFNWIHPFSGGNGRTARALAYLVVCMEHGAALPGVPSMPTLIFQDGDQYTRGLREADAGHLAGHEDLETILGLVGDAAIKQAMSALRTFSETAPARTGA